MTRRDELSKLGHKGFVAHLVEGDLVTIKRCMSPHWEVRTARVVKVSKALVVVNFLHKDGSPSYDEYVGGRKELSVMKFNRTGMKAGRERASVGGFGSNYFFLDLEGATTPDKYDFVPGVTAR